MKSKFLPILGALLLALGMYAHAQSPEVQVLPQPDGSVLILLPAATAEYCQTNGGCRIVTAADLQSFAAHVASEAKKSCGPNI